MTLIRKKIDVKAPLTDKQLVELENAAGMKVVMDGEKNGGKSIGSL